MSYDPNQDPNSGYGNPPYGVPPQGPYGQPQDPYGTPPQGPYGQPQGGPYSSPPQGPYGQPQAPYGYGVPPQGPYGAWPAPDVGYAPPVAPRPVGEAIKDLPSQYIKVVTHPSAATFWEEIVKADWAMVWAQLIGYAILIAVIGTITSLLFRAIAGAVTGSPSTFTALSAFTVATSISGALLNIVLIPLFFFIGVGIQYVLARAFNGAGTFLAQSYSSLLYQVPLGILGSVLALVLVLIPVVGILLTIPVGLALFIYAVVLNVFMIQSVHRLSGGKAAAVVLIPYGVAIVLGLLCTVAFSAFLISALQHMQPQPQP